MSLCYSRKNHHPQHPPHDNLSNHCPEFVGNITLMNMGQITCPETSVNDYKLNASFSSFSFFLFLFFFFIFFFFRRYNFNLSMFWPSQHIIFTYFDPGCSQSSFLFSVPSCHFLYHFLTLFVPFYSPLSTSIIQSGNPLSRFFSLNFFPCRGGWPRAKPPTWRTRVCIRFSPLYRLPSQRLWTHIQPT